MKNKNIKIESIKRFTHSLSLMRLYKITALPRLLSRGILITKTIIGFSLIKFGLKPQILLAFAPRAKARGKSFQFSYNLFIRKGRQILEESDKLFGVKRPMSHLVPTEWSDGETVSTRIRDEVTLIKAILCGILFLSPFVSAQNKNSNNHFLQNLTCKTCHTCDVPTKQNPCLVECPRLEMITVHQSAEKGPDVIKIDKLTDKYLPVTFSHRVHAQMSLMSGGCAGCHHYNTSGPILPCSDCHSAERKREDLSKPDLQAAYHRQCINCHKEWSHSTDCNSCHLEKGKSITRKESGELKGKKHPEVKEPEKLIYETNYNKGKIVTFFHNEHTSLFGADCVNCHQKENCTRCHDINNIKTVSSNIPEKIKKSPSQHHQPCFKCHANDECSKCHLDKPSGPFDHKISTGWALNRFHEKLECAKCHGNNNKFAKLNNSCISCHKNFVAGSFNHSITGLKLDETHADFECSDCHVENKFANKPDCSNCHDDKSYPKDKPGSTVNVSKK